MQINKIAYSTCCPHMSPDYSIFNAHLVQAVDNQGVMLFLKKMVFQSIGYKTGQKSLFF